MTILNPLQELAEKLKIALIDFGFFSEDDDDNHHLDYFDTVTVPILTASVGTLLQAERAAMIDKVVNSEEFEDELDAIAERSMQRILSSPSNWTTPYFVAAVKDALRNLATPEAASALAAVVQRETEKLREHLRWALSDECDSSMAEFQAKKAAALEAIK